MLATVDYPSTPCIPATASPPTAHARPPLTHACFRVAKKNTTTNVGASARISPPSIVATGEVRRVLFHNTTAQYLCFPALATPQPIETRVHDSESTLVVATAISPGCQGLPPPTSRGCFAPEPAPAIPIPPPTTHKREAYSTNCIRHERGRTEQFSPCTVLVHDGNLKTVFQHKWQNVL